MGFELYIFCLSWFRARHTTARFDGQMYYKLVTDWKLYHESIIISDNNKRICSKMVWHIATFVIKGQDCLLENGIENMKKVHKWCVENVFDNGWSYFLSEFHIQKVLSTHSPSLASTSSSKCLRHHPYRCLRHFWGWCSLFYTVGNTQIW
jgi:hypothetical protein